MMQNAMNSNHMDYSAFRRILLKTFIGFLSAAALVAVYCVLTGTFGETELKVLVTTLAISSGSICGMSCAAFIERKRAKSVGLVGVLAAAVAVLMVVFGVWSKTSEDEYWKTTVTFIIISIAFAHGCLLHLPDLEPRHRWTQRVAMILIALLALQVTYACWGKTGDESFYRYMAALSVLVVLITLVIPILSRMRGVEAASVQPAESFSAESQTTPDQLVLRRISGVIFADESGRRYQVNEVTPDGEQVVLSAPVPSREA